MKKYRILADGLTSLRIICSLLLIFTGAFSVSFYTLYIVCGISDMLDGYFARKSGGESAYGARLDSIADIIFIAVCTGKIIPSLTLPTYLIFLVCLIAVIRLVNILIGYLKYRRLILLHTDANKLTGLLLFLLLLTVSFIRFELSAVIVALCALYASAEEGFFIIKGRKINI